MSRSELQDSSPPPPPPPRWPQLETRLRRATGRPVLLFARAPAPHETPQDRQPEYQAWGLYLELACVRGGRVGGRVDVSVERALAVVTRVRSVSSYLLEREHGADEELLASLSNASSCVGRETFAEKRHPGSGNRGDHNGTRNSSSGAVLAAAGSSVASGAAAEAIRREEDLEDALSRALASVARDLLALFYASQVESLLSSGTQQARFEFEMLQHRPGLELLVTTSKRAGAAFVTFSLPLFAEHPAWSPRSVCAVEDPCSVFLPDAFAHANIDEDEAEKHGDAESAVLSIVYSLENGATNEDRGPARAWRPVSTAVQWPTRLQLSSQVVQVPVPSQMMSPIEILSSCEQSFLRQWNKRKQFVRELQSRVVVLEYDAVDFSRVFFMVQYQEQYQQQHEHDYKDVVMRDAHPPPPPPPPRVVVSGSAAPLALQIVLVSLEFPPAYFVTSCQSDLRVTLLDGEEDTSTTTSGGRSNSSGVRDRSESEVAPVELRLASSSSSVESASRSVDALVREFLAAVHAALAEHLHPAAR